MISQLLALVFILLMASIGHAGELDASWTEPTTNTDGSQLTDLGGYRVYYNQAAPPCPGTQFLQITTPIATPPPNSTFKTKLTSLIDSTLYYVAVTAVDLTGVESDCSTTASAVSRVAQVDPTPWTFCANENQTCTFTGAHRVRYGANGIYAPIQTFTNGVLCANSIFGDPAVGVQKTCDYDPQTTTPPVDTTPPAEPGQPVIGTIVAGPASVSIPVTWAPAIDQPSNLPVSEYPYSAGFNDGTGTVIGIAGTNATTLVMGYHSSGLATGAFTCVRAKDPAGNFSPDPIGQCNGFTVPAKPAPQTFALTILKSGTGTGQVTGAGSYAANTVATPTATPDASSYFSGWTGACTGAVPTCSVTMSSDKTATAVFTMKTYVLATSVVGSGTISASPSGGVYNYGTTVNLTATPAGGNQFTGWSGDCTGTGACSLTMLGNKTVTATFAPIQVQQFQLTLLTAGNGTITAAPLPVNGTYAAGTVVLLTATAAPGSQFSNWSGDCVGIGSCSVTMNAAKTVTATFTIIPIQQFTLSLTATPAGTGTISASPTPVNGTYAAGTVVTLTAIPAGSVFVGWSGACTGTGACVVTMNASKSVTATFTAGSISGTVTAKQNSCAEQLTIDNVPATTTSVRLYRNGSPDGAVDKSAPWIFNRNLPAGTTTSPFIYRFKADLTPSGTQRTFTPEIIVSCP